MTVPNFEKSTYVSSCTFGGNDLATTERKTMNAELILVSLPRQKQNYRPPLFAKHVFGTERLLIPEPNHSDSHRKLCFIFKFFAI